MAASASPPTSMSRAVHAPVGRGWRARVALLEAWAFTGVDRSSIVVFRIVLGLALLAAVVRHAIKGAIGEAFAVPTHFFAYDGLGFVRPLPGTGMFAVYAGIGLAALGLAAGFWTRASAAVAGVLFTWAHLADKANYLNHYHLLSLLLALVAILPLDDPEARRLGTAPRWVLWLLRLQLGVVYFYGGVGKLNTDWLFHAMPLRTWLAASGDFPVVGGLLRLSSAAIAMSWAGALFDLTVPALLTARRTRPYAYLAVVTFHLVTARLFQIGMFPWVMIGLTPIFFAPDWPRRLATKLGWDGFRPMVSGTRSSARGWLVFAGVWTLVQLLVPLRSHLTPGDVLWTEDGYRFSWRVMLVEKAGSAEFRAVDPVSGAVREVRVRDYLTPFQTKMMATQPDMIRSFARMVADDVVSRGATRPRVFADVLVVLNGRPASRLVDPTVDLAAEPAGVFASPSRFVLPSPRD